jgi:zinc protease
MQPSGKFIHKNGQLYGMDVSGKKYKINSTNPKIYVGIGNCLIGHIDKPDCMATSWIHSGGAYHMCGYIVPTWYGFMGWSLYWYFIMPGDWFTFAEAFFFTNQTLIMGLEERFSEIVNDPNCKAGHNYDKDAMVLYGDPAWDARIDVTDAQAFQQKLTIKPKEKNKYEFTFKLTSRQNKLVFDPKRGGTAGTFLPFRITNVENINTDSGGKVIVTDNFVLMQIKGTLNQKDERKVTFTAQKFKAGY